MSARWVNQLVGGVGGQRRDLVGLQPVDAPAQRAQHLVERGVAQLRLELDAVGAHELVAGAWFTGDWILGPLELDQIHPGYFLPTVAGGLVASAAAPAVGQVDLAQRSAPPLAALGVVLAVLGLVGTVLSTAGQFAPPLYLGLGVGGAERLAAYPGNLRVLVIGLLAMGARHS
jgi:hypothetical protein